MVEHWIDRRLRLNEDTKLVGNTPRMSASTIERLVSLQNEILGTNKTVYDKALEVEEERKTWFAEV